MAVVTSGTGQRDAGHPYRVVSRPVPLAPAMSERDMSPQCPVPSRCPAESLPGPVTSLTTATTADRWPLIVALLAAPTRESRRLADLLGRWPHVARKHWIADDLVRRQWRRG